MNPQRIGTRLGRRARGHGPTHRAFAISVLSSAATHFLMSMGARLQQIRRIFVYEGALIIATGTSIGLALGNALCDFADKYRWVKLNEQVYALSYVPFDAHWVDGFWIAAGAMVISLIATLYPAWNATRIAPAEALRYQ